MRFLARRRAPEPVEPIVVGGVRITVPQSRRDDPKFPIRHNGGFIAAYDAATGSQLWVLEVYKRVYDRNWEEDTQDVFIKRIEERDGKLWVQDEHDGEYLVDLTTRTVVKIADRTDLPWPPP